MSKKDDYIPRLSVDVRDDQLVAMQKWPHGLRRQLFEVIIDDLIKMMEVNPGVVMGGLITKKLKFTVEMRDGDTG